MEGEKPWLKEILKIPIVGDAIRLAVEVAYLRGQADLSNAKLESRPPTNAQKGADEAIELVTSGNVVRG